MKTKLLIFIFVVIAYAFFAFGSPDENTIKRSFTINQEGTVRLETLRGDIQVSTHGGNEVKLEAIVSTGDDDRAEFEKVKLEFEADANSVIIYTSPNIISLKADIDYYLKVPEKLKSLRLSTRSGKIKTRGTYRDIDLKTANGEIDFSGEFTGCKLRSANGDIDVYMRDTLKGDVTVESTNGSIKIAFKPGSGFAVEGKTLTGSIRSEFDTTTTSDLEGSKIKGTINDGTYKLNLATVNGNIQLLRQ
ncbi:MAG: DUF4097 family beta strand repeat protein [Candidatus Aminicenantes bacterium]|nr:MAG: DUF4097 family beta strand repeat protein [Candidatus Aminicenantes bacterium]